MKVAQEGKRRVKAKAGQSRLVALVSVLLVYNLRCVTERKYSLLPSARQRTSSKVVVIGF